MNRKQDMKTRSKRSTAVSWNISLITPISQTNQMMNFPITMATIFQKMIDLTQHSLNLSRLQILANLKHQTMKMIDQAIQ